MTQDLYYYIFSALVLLKSKILPIGNLRKVNKTLKVVRIEILAQGP